MKRSWFLSQVSISAIFLGVTASNAPVASLTPSRVELPLSHPIQIVDKAKCDSSGNLYVRVRPADGSGTSHLPIQKIGPGGNLISRFGTTDAQDTDVVQGIFVSETGIVYQAARTTTGVYIAGFGKDGSVQSNTKLEADPPIDPWQIVVFKTGGFLLSGLGGEAHRQPYAAVFDKNGKLLRAIYEPEDEDARRKAELRDADFTRSSAGNRFVGFGDITLGADGNAYLLRGTGAALVYVISPSGNVLRKLHLDAEGLNFAARNIASFNGRLAIEFIGPSDLMFVELTDLEGKIIAKYSMERNKPDWPDLACYDSKGFTFVTSYAQKNLYLIKAVPH